MKLWFEYLGGLSGGADQIPQAGWGWELLWLKQLGRLRSIGFRLGQLPDRQRRRGNPVRLSGQFRL